MQSLSVILDLEREGFRPGKYPVREYEGPLTIGGMPRGTDNGHPTVMIGLEEKDGTVLVAETTLALFLTAADALIARYGDPRGSKGTN